MNKKKKSLEIRLVIPDAGVLISLAHGGLLDVLFGFSTRTHIVVTDVVMFEATQRNDLADAQVINEFVNAHKEQIAVEATSAQRLIELAKNDPTILPDDIGETSIYGYINAIRNDYPGIPTLVIFEDQWFIANQHQRPRNTHLLSLSAFLKAIERLNPDFLYKDAIDAIRKTRPHVHLVDLDDPAESGTEWKPAYGKDDDEQE